MNKEKIRKHILQIISRHSLKAMAFSGYLKKTPKLHGLLVNLYPISVVAKMNTKTEINHAAIK